MDSKESHYKRQEYTAKLIFTAAFLGAFVLVAWLGRRVAAGEFRPGVFDLVLLAFATFRLGRLVAYDVVMEPLRRPVAHTVPDHTGAGESVEAWGQGARRALGQLISCPICAGTWIAALLTYALYLAPGPTRLFLLAAAAIGAAELLNGLAEALCWTGQLNRTLTGAELRRMAPAGRSESTEASVGVAAAGESAVNVVYTQDLLRLALERLLAQKSRFHDKSDLRLDAVDIQDGEAVIRLSGRILLGGECDLPRVIAQLEETARQFSAVRRVAITLNSRPIQEMISLR